MSIIPVMFTSFPPQGYLTHGRSNGKFRIISNQNTNRNQYQKNTISSGASRQIGHGNTMQFIATVNGCGTRSNDLQEINGEETNLDVSEDATPMDEAEGGRPGRQLDFP